MIDGVIAIVGRPNVGKSSLFNRIMGDRISIVHEEAGVTRDRIYGKTKWLTKDLRFIDTGGIQIEGQPFAQEIKMQVDVAIEEADVILLGIGSLYTSILPNLIVPEINKAILKSEAKKIYYCNAMSQPGETNGYSAEDHVDALLMHCHLKLDAVVIANDNIPDSTLDRYKEEGSYPIYFKSKDQDYLIIEQNLIEIENDRIRHNPLKVSEGIYEVLELVGCPLAVK